MKLAWLTDVHLNFLREDVSVQFLQSIARPDIDAFLFTGDISSSQTLNYDLSLIEKYLQRQVYFVLGNHDYYGSSIKNVRQNMETVKNRCDHVTYLGNVLYEKLSPTTAIVGHDCWYDAILGDPYGSSFLMNDWRFIQDYAMLTHFNIHECNDTQIKQKIINLSRELATCGVKHIHDGIKQATKFAKHIIVASHPPPFKESSMNEGTISDPGSLPWFSCKLLGDCLTSAAKAFPNIQFTSLSGHTHSFYENKQYLPNLDVKVGEAKYALPKIQLVIDV